MVATRTQIVPQPGFAPHDFEESEVLARVPAPVVTRHPARVEAAAVADQAHLDAEQVRVEVALVRSSVIGAVIGMFVCAGIWTGLVAIATVGSGYALLPALGMAAGCGVFAGLFLGGCAGALAGSRGLERVEHERMHPARTEPGTDTPDAA